MPEYLAPGVYVEETSFRAKSIEGVGTSTTAFVGPTRKGPFRADTNDQEVPELLTSYGDFERIYGGIADFGFSPATNYLAHAVRAPGSKVTVAPLKLALPQNGQSMRTLPVKYEAGPLAEGVEPVLKIFIVSPGDGLQSRCGATNARPVAEDRDRSG